MLSPDVPPGCRSHRDADRDWAMAWALPNIRERPGFDWSGPHRVSKCMAVLKHLRTAHKPYDRRSLLFPSWRSILDARRGTQWVAVVIEGLMGVVMIAGREVTHCVQHARM